VEDVIIEVEGSPALPVRVYDGRPVPSAAAATVVYLHGGGWVAGDVDAFDTFSRTFAAAAGCRLVSVGYRLSPEAEFGAAVDDTVTACSWAVSRYAATPLAVMGDSAGGNLAAVYAVLARDGLAPPVDLQVLVYPIIHRQTTTSSHVAHGTGGLMGRTDVEWYWEQYLGTHAADDPRAQPALADLAGVAPAVVVVAEHDPLRDDGLSYAALLGQAGVPVKVHYYPDMPHGFFTMIGLLDTQREVVDRVAGAVRRLTSPTPSEP
jgi:acetyl esterase